MPAHNLSDCSANDVGHNARRYGHRGVDVVDRASRLEAVQEPQPLLAEREGEHLGASPPPRDWQRRRSQPPLAQELLEHGALLGREFGYPSVEVVHVSLAGAPGAASLSAR